jgi:hypothetical protein
MELPYSLTLISRKYYIEKQCFKCKLGLKPYENFLNRLDSKELQTKQMYIKDFKYYLQFLKLKDPNSLITKRFIHPKSFKE